MIVYTHLRYMDLNKFTEKSKTIILEAYSVAVSKKHQLVEPIHLFKSLLEDELVKEIFLSLGTTIQEILKLTNKTSYPIAQLAQREKNRGRKKGES